MMKKDKPTHEQIEKETHRYEVLGGIVKKLPPQPVLPRAEVWYACKATGDAYHPAPEADTYAGTAIASM